MKLALPILLAVASVASAGPLTVEVKPASLAWHRGKHVEVALRVVNTSRAKQTIRAWSCSWDQNWQASDPALGWEPWGCDKNFVRAVELAPGKAYEQVLPMVAAATAALGTHRLTMAFTPDGGAPIASAEVAIDVER